MASSFNREGDSVFTIYSDSGSDSTMVSNLFIDEYMKSANDAQIKIYLYLLRVMGAHKTTSVSDLADQFNHTEKDVVRSLRYWEKKGLLDLTFRKDPACAGGQVPEGELVSVCLRQPSTADKKADLRADAGGRVLSFTSAADTLQTCLQDSRAVLPLAAGQEVPIAGAPAVESAGTVEKGNPTETPGELEALEIFRHDARKAQLLFVVEQYIGKPLSLKEVRSIYYLSEILHFSDKMIDYLLQYCIDRGKRDFRYIRKVAENWAEAGITTPSEAEASEETGRSGGSASASGSGRNEKGRTSAARSDAARTDAAVRQTNRSKSRSRSSNSFNQFEQNSYDFDALEQELLKNS
ncbi:MAG: DnaD domain protein [Lachnospiraceae bacterium]|nr:DnaD domain protein [Lachnospiraceae bacterium]